MSKTTTDKPQHSIRWMIRRDIPSVLEIENESFDSPWNEDTFIRYLRCRICIGMVVETDDRISGFMIYELHKKRLHLLNFAVAKRNRRTGVGTAMIQKLASKLNHERRTRLLLEVRESNLDAQLFFRANGMRAISTLRDFYEDTDEAAYLMELRWDQEALIQ